MPIVLASASPRRRALIAQLGLPVEHREADVPEIPLPIERPAETALRLACEKVRKVAGPRSGAPEAEEGAGPLSSPLPFRACPERSEGEGGQGVRSVLVTIEVLAWLRPKLGYPEGEKVVLEREVAPGESVGSLFARLAAEVPGFGEHVYAAAEDRVYEHVTVLLDGRAVELVGGTRAPLSDGSRLILLPGFAGGAALTGHLAIP